MVYGDLGRYPLYVNSYVTCLRYWLKLLQMDIGRLPHKAYIMLLELDRCGKNCWVTKVREILCETGYNIVWLQQGVGDIKMFLMAFKQRLIDWFIQEWDGTTKERERYQMFTTYKTVFEKEKYIYDMDIYCFRVAITQLRFNVLPLNNNVHRYSKSAQDKNCSFCDNQVEDEDHFLFHCCLYKDLRDKFLKKSSNAPIHVLLKATNADHRHNVSRYVFHAINRRKKILGF